VTISGVSFGHMLDGPLIIEQIFNYRRIVQRPAKAINQARL